MTLEKINSLNWRDIQEIVNADIWVFTHLKEIISAEFYYTEVINHLKRKAK